MLSRFAPIFTYILTPMALFGCQDTIDDVELARFRRALPSKQHLQAPNPAHVATPHGGEALFPLAAIGPANAINGAALSIVDSMHNMVSIPPTAYDEKNQEFFWGPYKNEGGFGTIGAYIRENPAGSDFQYSYALVRGTADGALLQPIIWGAATISADDDRFGIALWDFEADYQFDVDHFPEAGFAKRDRGRFAAIYEHGSAANESAVTASSSYVVAIFRNFISSDSPLVPAAHANYFYGRYKDHINEHQLDFMEFEFPHNIEDLEGNTPENMRVRLAFLNTGAGRAEALASGGDLPEHHNVVATECWSSTLERTFVEFLYDDGAEPTSMHSLGQEETHCSGVFAQNLDALALPKLADVPSKRFAGLESLASGGAAGVSDR